jgi:hypothetical protein
MIFPTSTTVSSAKVISDKQRHNIAGRVSGTLIK